MQNRIIYRIFFRRAILFHRNNPGLLPVRGGLSHIHFGHAKSENEARLREMLG